MAAFLSTLLIFLLCIVCLIDKSMGIAIPPELPGNGRFTSAEKFSNVGSGTALAGKSTCNETFFIGKMAVMAHRNLLYNEDLVHLNCNRGLWAIFYDR